METIYSTPKLRVKILRIKPGHRTSKQYHNERNEVMFLNNGEVEYFFAGQDHRISNSGKNKKSILEVSIALDGCTIKESDIVRLEDDYGRVKK